jgi:hypothetical protein
VLDAERERAKDLPPVPEAALPPPPPPQPIDRPPRELEGRAGSQARAWDIGLSPFLLVESGAGKGAIDTGVDGYVTLGMDYGAFVRIGLAGAYTATPDYNWSHTYGSIRLELCSRVHHLFKTGVDFEYGGGPEIGLHEVEGPSKQVILIALGPSAALRAALFDHLWFETRFVTALNIGYFFPDSDRSKPQPALFVGRLELGFSWRFD